MTRLAALVFWAFSTVSSLLALVYLAGFIHNRYSFNSIDSGLQIPTGEALAVNVALLALFGFQHSGMARRWFKRFVPAPIERSVYLTATAGVLAFLFFRWEPMPRTVWLVSVRWPFSIAIALSAALVAWSTISQGVLHFFGFHQVWAYVRGRTYSQPEFKSTGPYRYSRHPLMVGTVVFIWATHHMTQGHLVFSLVLTLYILLAVRWEERDLERVHGDAYRGYRRRVSAIVPLKTG